MQFKSIDFGFLGQKAGDGGGPQRSQFSGSHKHPRNRVVNQRRADSTLMKLSAPNPNRAADSSDAPNPMETRPSITLKIHDYTTSCIIPPWPSPP